MGNNGIYAYQTTRVNIWGWLAGLVQHATLDLRVMNSSSHYRLLKKIINILKNYISCN